MTKVRYDEIYIYSEIGNFIEEIDFVYDVYNSKIKNIFDSPENEAKKYGIYLNENTSLLNSYSPDDCLIEIESKMQQRYFQVKNMKYRNLINYINLTYQMFDQFLIVFVKQKIDFIITDKELLKSMEDKKIDYKKFFLQFDFDITKLDGYSKIKEMRLLQNVFKHGLGPSMNTLKKLRPDFFEESEKMSSLNMFNNTIIDDTLNIKECDFEEYISAIKKVLGQFPSKLVHKYEVEE